MAFSVFFRQLYKVWMGRDTLIINYIKPISSVYKFHSYLPWNKNSMGMVLLWLRKYFVSVFLPIFIGYVQFNLYLC